MVAVPIYIFILFILFIHKDKDKIKLQPENDTMEPIIVDPKENSIRIIGKIEGVIRKV